MAEVITDQRIVAVLRPFVRATSPVLRALREADPLRLRRGVRVEADDQRPELARSPDTPALEAAEVDESTAARPAEGTRGESAETELTDERSINDDSEHSEDASAREARAPEERQPESVPPEADSEVTGPILLWPESSLTVTGDVGDSHPAASADSTASAEEKAGALEKLRRQLDGMQLPGSSVWDSMTIQERSDWWAKRVGRFLALVTGLPRFGGVITSKLPLRNALGMAGQGLVLCAIAEEHGVTDQTTQVRLIAKVLLERDLPTEVAAGQDGPSRAEEDAKTAELTEEIDESRTRFGRPSPKAIGRTVWRMARTLWEIHSELDKRPQGRFYHEAIGSIPVVGVVGGYFGERSALRRVGRRGVKWIRQHQGS